MDSLKEDSKYEDFKQIAFVGRSNVGKSTLINSILGQKSLLKCSKTPGKTQNLHFLTLSGLNLQLVDCPGYGFAKVSAQEKEKWKQFMMHYLQRSEILHRVVVLIDIKVGIQDSDKMVIDMLTDLNRIFFVVLTKADKINAR